ncbi:MAG: Gfo/Idh/MocA family oxidoreductase, partial [Planctomycetes bacterium]|nr:Gfo/Idh/MocA family oxidoreductase [Planctomycetota bacterium]
MKKIRWGMIGCGVVTEVKSGPALQKTEGSSIVAVMRRNGVLAEDYARRHGIDKWYDDAKKLIGEPDVDAVYVATPPSSHKEYTIAAANAGKDVYVEKPMAMTFDECQEMIAACRGNGVRLFVAYYRRALPRFVKIKSLIDGGAVGKVSFADVVYHKRASEGDIAGIENWRVDPQIAGGGYFYDLAPHSIDILQFLLGDATSAKGYVSNQRQRYEAEDIVSGVMRLGGDVHVTLVWNFNAYGYMDRTEIVGDKGKLTFSTFGDGPIVLETQEENEDFNIENPLHIQQPLIQTIVNELRGDGHSPSTGDSAAKTNWV